VEEMHIDGFRFDLAAALARQLQEIDQLSAFFNIIHQDPVISRVKLIAEPWDLGPGGYQVGNFPLLWAEWNGKYRDRVRHYWRNDGNHLGDFVTRFSGSPDLYETNGKKPHSSINYVTSHDGFTLHDLVSYERKHNETNQEGNKDGMDENISSNFGIEGNTDDIRILRQREKRRRNFLITLFSSQGAPMILGGDEIGRSQGGNNNAYCQDNDISWYNWNLNEAQRSLLEFTRRMISLRTKYHALRRRDFFRGEIIPGTGKKDVVWIKADGTEMAMEDWKNNKDGSFGVLLSGTGTDDSLQDQGILEDDLLVLFNPGFQPVEFTLPGHWSGQEILIDSIPENTYRFPIPMDWKKITLEEGSSAIIKEKKINL
jgi:glycogen operon protein